MPPSTHTTPQPHFIIDVGLVQRGLGLLTCKTVSRITYTVLVETLNPAQSSPVVHREDYFQYNSEPLDSVFQQCQWNENTLNDDDDDYK